MKIANCKIPLPGTLCFALLALAACLSQAVPVRELAEDVFQRRAIGRAGLLQAHGEQIAGFEQHDDTLAVVAESGGRAAFERTGDVCHRRLFYQTPFSDFAVSPALSTTCESSPEGKKFVDSDFA